MTAEIGYKVVRVSGSDLIPADIYTDIPRFAYHENAWKEPPLGFGPMSLFETLDQAIAFKAKMLYPTRIYKCKYVKSNETTLYHPVYTEDQNGRMETGFPTGTVFADMLMLVEEITAHSDV